LGLGLLGVALPVGAITWGQKDDAGLYPNVGTVLLSMPSAGGVYEQCSGTLIHPKVFLTAGHCTFRLPGYLDSGLVDKIYVSFAADPGASSETWLEVETVITHPDFSFKRQSNWHDNGVLILRDEVGGIEPAVLPEEGFLDRLQAEGALGHGTNGAKFTVVGYGSSLSFPPPRIYYEGVRQFAQSEFRALLPAWLRMSQQGRTGDGGTGYGDSGGPAFWEEPDGTLILVATTTWGDPNIVTSGFSQRIDVASSLRFIEAVLDEFP
jgi:hypothetical protein